MIDQQALRERLVGVPWQLSAPRRLGRTRAVAEQMRAVRETRPELDLVLHSLTSVQERCFAADFPDVRLGETREGASCALFLDEGLLFSPDQLLNALSSAEAELVYIYMTTGMADEERIRRLQQSGFLFVEAPLVV